MSNLDVPKKFIIISYSRTGSNFLVSLLNSHPNKRVAVNYWEKLLPIPTIRNY